MTLAYQLEPASCSKSFTFEQFRTLTDADLDGYYADEKFDGRRYLHQVRPAGARFNYLTSRRVSKTTGQMVEKQDSMPFFRDCMFGPKDSVYDGEMVHPDGGTSHEAATAIAKDIAVFRIFDVLRFNGEDVRHWPQLARWNILNHEIGRVLPERMVLVPRSKRPRRLLNAVRANDGEGIILKLPDAAYGEGWFKVVSVEFHDVVVTGYEMSDSDKYGPKGWIKGVKFSQWIRVDPKNPPKLFSAMRGQNGEQWALVEMGQTSGFTEAMRAKISANQSKFMGQVMMIRAKGRELSGAFRHPRFHDWHPDKNSWECTYAKTR